MEWLANLTGGENAAVVNFVLISALLVIALIIIVAVFRRITGTAAKRAMRSRVPRLTITDSTNVDEKRFLVMVRRDNVEHLLLVGGANDLVVETNIVRTQPPQKANTPTAVQRPVEPQPLAEEIKEEPTPINAPLASAAAIGAAGIASVATTATTAAETSIDTVAEIATEVKDEALNAVESVTETATETATEAMSNIKDASSEAIDAALENISLDMESTVETPEIPLAVVEPETSITAEIPATNADEIIEVPETVETIEAVEAPEIVSAVESVTNTDLESEISAKLDDALSADVLDIDLPEASQPETSPIPKVSSDETQAANASDNNNAVEEDDEMQRLLKELSSEVKEPA